MSHIQHVFLCIHIQTVNCATSVLTETSVRIENPAMLNDNGLDSLLLVSKSDILLKGYFVDLSILMASFWRLKDPAFRLLSKNPPFSLCFFFS